MGIVWQARDERLDRTVAIKQLLMRAGLSDSQADDARRRAMREGRIAARLQHRNAIAMFDVAEHDGDPCLIMEYLPSRSLAGVLAERGTLPPDEAARIGAQVATALTAAHAAGIVHRDVKPGNILIDDTGQVKITDFGISRASDDGTMTASSVGMLAGTPAYLAPEVARGQDPTRASDVFSLGATLYHAVEGQPPYGFKDNPLAQLYAVAMGNVPQPKNAGPLTETLMRLLAMEAADRPTMPEVVMTLAELAGAETMVALPTPPMPVVPVQAPPGAGAAKVPSAQAQSAQAQAAQAQAVQNQPTLVAPGRVQAPVKPAKPASPPPPPPVKPPQPRPEPSPRPAGNKKRLLAIIGVVLGAALLGGLVATLVSSGGGQEQNANPGPGAPPTTVTVQATPSPGQQPSETPSSAPPLPQAGNQGPIDWSSAGRLVIAYYGSASPDARWAMLTPQAQQVFGGFEAFQAYWAQYPQLSSRNANGVRQNADGSVIVPVDVTYGPGNSAHKELHVMNIGGQLKIASDSK